MSELTRCNYCSFKDIKARTSPDEKIVQRRSTMSMGGIEIYRVPETVYVPIMIDRDSEFHKKYFVSWQMERSERCCC